MSTAVVTESGAARGTPGRRKRSRSDLMVPDASFESYYGKPVINGPVWEARDIAGYLFLGGLAGGSSLLGAGAQLSRRRSLARGAKATAAGAISLSLAALVHDLGRPSRFVNMLRVFKPSSPMSVGSWILAAYAPATLVAAASEVTGALPVLGPVATAGAAALGPAVAAYTAALISNTAVPAWHEGHREMPFVFVSSAASAAGGAGLVVATLADNGPARRLAVLGGITELAATKAMERRLPAPVVEAYHEGKARDLMRASEALTVAGVVAASLAGRRSRVVAALSGAALVAASACTRFGIFYAGKASAADPAATVRPQRERLAERSGA